MRRALRSRRREQGAEGPDEPPVRISRTNLNDIPVRSDERSETPMSINSELQNQLTEARAEITALRSQIVSTSQVVIPNKESENTNTNWAVFKNDQLIPVFDPSNLTQNVDDWLHRVNNCAKMYHWDAMTTVYLALGKLRGTARIWYDGLRTTQYSWPQWETMLRDMFPSKVTFGKLLYDAASYRAGAGQDLNDYCFHKLAKLNKLNLNLLQEQIVDCIIEGIPDPQTKLSIKAARCTTFVELAEYVTNFPCTALTKKNIIYERKGKVNSTYEGQNEIICFYCKFRHFGGTIDSFTA